MALASSVPNFQTFVSIMAWFTFSTSLKWSGPEGRANNKTRNRKINVDCMESRLYNFLLQYHVTPQALTKEAPCVLLNKRLLRTRLDLVKPDIVENVREIQSKMKVKHDVHVKREESLCR